MTHLYIALSNTISQNKYEAKEGDTPVQPVDFVYHQSKT